jgi:hypothetical protein
MRLRRSACDGSDEHITKSSATQRTPGLARNIGAAAKSLELRERDGAKLTAVSR